MISKNKVYPIAFLTAPVVSYTCVKILGGAIYFQKTDEVHVYNLDTFSYIIHRAESENILGVSRNDMYLDHSTYNFSSVKTFMEEYGTASEENGLAAAFGRRVGIVNASNSTTAPIASYKISYGSKGRKQNFKIPPVNAEVWATSKILGDLYTLAGIRLDTTTFTYTYKVIRPDLSIAWISQAEYDALCAQDADESLPDFHFNTNLILFSSIEEVSTKTLDLKSIIDAPNISLDDFTGKIVRDVIVPVADYTAVSQLGETLFGGKELMLCAKNTDVSALLRRKSTQSDLLICDRSRSVCDVVLTVSSLHTTAIDALFRRMSLLAIMSYDNVPVLAVWYYAGSSSHANTAINYFLDIRESLHDYMRIKPASEMDIKHFMKGSTDDRGFYIANLQKDSPFGALYDFKFEDIDTTYFGSKDSIQKTIDSYYKELTMYISKNRSKVAAIEISKKGQ